MYDELKRLGLVRRVWRSKASNWLRNTAYGVAIVTLIFTATQVGLAKSALEVSRADLEARTRPYLSIEKVGVNNTGDGWISTNITINNLGEMPATHVNFGDVLLNGAKIAGTEPDIDYPTWVYTTEDGVTITGGGLVTIPPHSGPPTDMMLFPQKPTTIGVLTLGSVQYSAITEGSILEIGLDYSWGDRQYECMATALWSEGEWKVILQTGD